MNHESCQRLEKAIRIDAGLKQRDFWTYRGKRTARPLFEVYGPGKFYWQGRACCAWGARVDAYDAYDQAVRQIKIELH